MTDAAQVVHMSDIRNFYKNLGKILKYHTRDTRR